VPEPKDIDAMLRADARAESALRVTTEGVAVDGSRIAALRLGSRMLRGRTFRSRPHGVRCPSRMCPVADGRNLHGGMFRDRHHAGLALGEAIGHLAGEAPVVIGLPRGGVPVAFEVARALAAPLDVLVSRKVGAPGNPEFAIGAVAEGDVSYIDGASVAALLIGHEELEQATQRAAAEVSARAARYRGAVEPVPLAGRTVIVVDDGLATGATARAALRAARTQRPRRLVLAVPVGAPDSVRALAAEADEVVCLEQPRHLFAVGLWYEDFGQTSDAEVIDLLQRAREARAPATVSGAAADPPPVRRSVTIGLAEPGHAVDADLVVPDGATGLVIFAHGSGSSRHSSRNRHVAAALNRRGLATLLLDLLEPREELDRRNVFDIPLLAERLVAATRWSRTQSELRSLAIGYFGASTGAGAALWAAAEADGDVRTVISRGGRPDLAGPRLSSVSVPVLLIVGGHDPVVLELNREAQRLLAGPCELAVVPGATHLFEEPGTLDQVAELAGAWFARHLQPEPATMPTPPR
jgi:putative phosphoribosyl transferase